MKKYIVIILILILLIILGTCALQNKGEKADDSGAKVNDQEQKLSDDSSKEDKDNADKKDGEEGTDTKDGEDADDKKDTTEGNTDSQSSNSDGSNGGDTDASDESDMSKYRVPGYELGAIPAFPLIQFPVIPKYSAEQAKILGSLRKEIQGIKGIRIKPAVVENGKLKYFSKQLIRSNKAAIINNKSGKAVITKKKDVLSSKDMKAVVNNDGSGVLNKDGVSVVVNADGSGTLIDEKKGINITRNADGTGTYSDGKVNIVVKGEYKGSYQGPNYSMIYTKEGEAQFSSKVLQIIVSKGKATITKGDKTVTVDAKPLAKIPLFPKIPPLEKLRLDNIGGIRIIFDESILFDFDKSELRPEGKVVVEKLVNIVKKLNIKTVEIHGHTDSIGSDSYNQNLSEQRANAVKAYAVEKGISGNVKAIGFGESEPVAPNQNEDGTDNPSGRQLNRRVEFFLPIK